MNATLSYYEQEARLEIGSNEDRNKFENEELCVSDGDGKLARNDATESPISVETCESRTLSKRVEGAMDGQHNSYGRDGVHSSEAGRLDRPPSMRPRVRVYDDEASLPSLVSKDSQTTIFDDQPSFVSMETEDSQSTILDDHPTICSMEDSQTTISARGDTFNVRLPASQVLHNLLRPVSYSQMGTCSRPLPPVGTVDICDSPATATSITFDDASLMSFGTKSTGSFSLGDRHSDMRGMPVAPPLFNDSSSREGKSNGKTIQYEQAMNGSDPSMSLSAFFSKPAQEKYAGRKGKVEKVSLPSLASVSEGEVLSLPSQMPSLASISECESSKDKALPRDKASCQKQNRVLPDFNGHDSSMSLGDFLATTQPAADKARAGKGGKYSLPSLASVSEGEVLSMPSHLTSISSVTGPSGGTVSLPSPASSHANELSSPGSLSHMPSLAECSVDEFSAGSVSLDVVKDHVQQKELPLHNVSLDSASVNERDRPAVPPPPPVYHPPTPPKQKRQSPKLVTLSHYGKPTTKQTQKNGVAGSPPKRRDPPTPPKSKRHSSSANAYKSHSAAEARRSPPKESKANILNRARAGSHVNRDPPTPPKSKRQSKRGGVSHKSRSSSSSNSPQRYHQRLSWSRVREQSESTRACDEEQVSDHTASTCEVTTSSRTNSKKLVRGLSSSSHDDQMSASNKLEEAKYHSSSCNEIKPAAINNNRRKQRSVSDTLSSDDDDESMPPGIRKRRSRMERLGSSSNRHVDTNESILTRRCMSDDEGALLKESVSRNTRSMSDDEGVWLKGRVPRNTRSMSDDEGAFLKERVSRNNRCMSDDEGALLKEKVPRNTRSMSDDEGALLKEIVSRNNRSMSDDEGALLKERVSRNRPTLSSGPNSKTSSSKETASRTFRRSQSARHFGKKNSIASSYESPTLQDRVKLRSSLYANSIEDETIGRHGTTTETIPRYRGVGVQSDDESSNTSHRSGGHAGTNSCMSRKSDSANRSRNRDNYRGSHGRGLCSDVEAGDLLGKDRRPVPSTTRRPRSNGFKRAQSERGLGKGPLSAYNEFLNRSQRFGSSDWATEDDDTDAVSGSELNEESPGKTGAKTSAEWPQMEKPQAPEIRAKKVVGGQYGSSKLSFATSSATEQQNLNRIKSGPRRQRLDRAQSARCVNNIHM